MSRISLFEEKQVRRAWSADQQKWLFAIVDVIAILTGSVDPGAYWRKLKERLKKEGNETVTDCHGLKMTAADGKQRMTDVADTEQLLRLIQSIPSPRAEPFKRWLAKVGYERLEEIENPELAAKRTREIYGQKGYSEEWIAKRLRGIAVRDELTDEWKKRGVREGREFGILTAEISKATFGMTPSEYKEFKALSNPKDNLRDHMTDLELIFTMLGEAPRPQKSPKSAMPRVFPKTAKPPTTAALSPAKPAATSKNRAARKSQRPPTSKHFPNPANGSQKPEPAHHHENLTSHFRRK